MLSGRTDVLAAEKSVSGHCVLHTDHRLQCYDRDKLSHVYENIDDFVLSETWGLIAASGGRRGLATPGIPGELTFVGVDVEGLELLRGGQLLPVRSSASR